MAASRRILIVVGAAVAVLAVATLGVMLYLRAEADKTYWPRLQASVAFDPNACPYTPPRLYAAFSNQTGRPIIGTTFRLEGRGTGSDPTYSESVTFAWNLAPDGQRASCLSIKPDLLQGQDPASLNWTATITGIDFGN
ncbi:MAG: hypothetical protein ABL866_08935 [Devosia sp.]